MPKFTALPTSLVRRWQNGGPDANGQQPEVTTSDGVGNPCRHCLRDIPKGARMLILGHRPFDTLHPYAETGPIFVCAAPCDQGGGSADIPDILTTSPDYLVKGYWEDERILYGTGAIIPADELRTKIDAVFANPDIAFLHIRSARNNCYQLRVDRD